MIRDFTDVWEDASDEALLAQIPLMVMRMIQVLRYHGEDRFIESEPSSVLGALKILKERHG